MITVLAAVRNVSEASALFWTLRCQTERRWALWCTAAAPTTLREFETLGQQRAAGYQLRTATYPRGTSIHQQLTPLVKIVSTPLVLLVPPGGLLGAGVVAAAVAHVPGTSQLQVSPTDSDHGPPPQSSDLQLDQLRRSVLWVAAATLRRAWTPDAAETWQRLHELVTIQGAECQSGVVSCVM